MKLLEVKHALEQVNEVRFKLPSGESVPEHFHVTEIGLIDRYFIDCGGTKRRDSKVNFQLYTADDYDHRLSAYKLNDIIDLSRAELDLEDNEVEVEYQGDTIGKYGLEFNGKEFVLTTTQTDCLAKDSCGIPEQSASNNSNCCSPETNCC